MPLTWRDTEELAKSLARMYPGRDPLRVPPEELRRLVVGLPGFVDDQGAAGDAELEELLGAWYDAVQE